MSNSTTRVKNIKSRFTGKNVLILIFVGILSITGIYFFSQSKISKTTPTYQSATVTKGRLIVAVTGSGNVTSANNSPVLTSATGVVKEVFVKEGDSVKSGQKIASLDLDQSGNQKYLAALANYQNAKNNLASARSNSYSANSTMWAAHEKLMSDAVSRNLPADDPTMIQQSSDWNAAELRYQTSLSNINQAQSAMASANLSLKQSSAVIYAPITGTIAGLTITKGTVIAATVGTTSSDSTTNKKIASVITTASPSIAVSLSEIDVPKVKVGDQATVTLTATGEKTYNGRVTSIDTSGSINSGVTTYPAYIVLDNTVDSILPNMSATANIITATKDDVLRVPTSSLTTSPEGKFAKLLVNGKAVLKPVEIGIQSDTMTEIISGLNDGDVVIIGSSTSSVTKSTSTQSVFSLGGRSSGGNTVRMISR